LRPPADLFGAVAELTERQRQIMLIADVAGLGPKEVQQRLGISDRTYQRDHAATLQAIATHLSGLLEERGRDQDGEFRSGDRRTDGSRAAVSRFRSTGGE